jgi:hypothetical protein
MIHRLCLAAALLSSATAVHAFDDHLFAVTSDNERGDCAALELETPWTPATQLEAIGVEAHVRHFYGRHYVVNPAAGTVQVIDPETFDTVLTISVGMGSTPHDILVVDPRTAYVSRYDSTLLYRVDPTTGAFVDSIDLGGFAADDGLPDMSMMARDGRHLFVQIQRVDRALSGNPVPPSLLAVIDIPTSQLLDVDPNEPGTQGIELLGTFPRFKMHVDSVARRLFVSAPGVRLDVSGGIEEVDLDALESLGFILPEEETIGDLGAFVMVSPDRGYFWGHTDIVESSHLLAFSRAGMLPGELYLTFTTVQSLAFDASTSQLFIPDCASTVGGIQVLDTTTNALLTGSAIDTAGAPVDVVVARETTPGEAGELLVTGFASATGELSLSYRPACAGFDHNLVWGPLEEVNVYGYSGRRCGIGNSGTYETFDPGAGSYFFLVVATDGVEIEGSYGIDGTTERPDDPGSPECSFVQNLGLRCDGG